MRGLNNKLIRNYHTVAAIILMSLISVILIICVKGKHYSDSPVSKEGFYFDTVISITIYDTKENYGGYINSYNEITRLLDECMDICEKYQYIFSRTDEKSELYKLNHTEEYLTGKEVRISDELSELIRETLKYSEVFGDRFSIFSGNLCDLWNYKNRIIPEDEQIQSVLENMKNHQYTLSGDKISVIYNSPDSTDKSEKTIHAPEINLGASAKGYIADRLGEFLKSKGVKEAIINLGGNVLVIGDKYDNSMYTIGIRKPFSDSSDIFAKCKVADKSIVTSGIYERYFKQDGTIYHHIIDCTTGYPADNGILSVTVICDSSLVADCYTTGCLLYSADDILKFINEDTKHNIECIIIDKDYNIILSDGLTYDGEYIVLK